MNWTWLRSLERGMSPHSLSCTMCGASYKDKRALALCRECYNIIPWIREVICDKCGRYEACYDCKRREQTYFVSCRSAVQYDATMKAWLARYKYRGDERLQKLFSSMLKYAFKTNGSALLTFVPVSPDRFLERGFNQAEQLARDLGKACNVPVIPLLKRTRITDKQSFKKRSDRLEDLEGAFAMDGGEWAQFSEQHLTPMEIYIIDDIYTTGSTLNQCAKVLVQGTGARIHGLCWARS